jgi:hypothetical protein
MTDLTLNEYAEFALHQRAAGRTVVADVIDALLDAQVARANHI